MIWSSAWRWRDATVEVIRAFARRTREINRAILASFVFGRTGLSGSIWICLDLGNIRAQEHMRAGGQKALVPRGNFESSWGTRIPQHRAHFLSHGKIVASETIFYKSEISRHTQNDLVSIRVCQRRGRDAGKGAQFRVVDGNQKLFIECADDDSTKACVDAISPLLNRFWK